MLGRLYSLDKGEQRRALWLFAYTFGNAGSYVVVRTVADSTFLSHIGTERLPALYMLSAGVVAIASVIYGNWARRSELHKLMIGTLLLLAATSAGAPALMFHFPDSLAIYTIIYLLAQIRGTLGTIQFTTLLNEQFGASRPERVVGFIGAGANVAGVLVGSLIGWAVHFVEVESLMYLVALLDILTMIPILRLEHTPVGNVRSQQTKKLRHLSHAIRVPYIVEIASVVTLTVIVGTVIEYQWKVAAAITLRRDEAALAEYFGYFYSVVYLITGLLQLFLTHRILKKQGLLFGLLAFPSALFFATGLAWVVETKRLVLWPMTISKACDTLKRSLNEPSIHIIYSPLDRLLRRQAITFVAGIAKPFAEALAAVLLVLLAPFLDLRYFSLLALTMISIWIALDIQLWRHFRTLRRRHRRYRIDASDSRDEN